MIDLTMDQLRLIINGELRQSNIFVNRILEAAEIRRLPEELKLAQMVVALAHNNNDLQSQLIKQEYAKAFPDPVVLMDEAKARSILGDAIQPDNSLFNLGEYVSYEVGDTDVCLDARFTVEQLEAITWWMRFKQ